MYQHIIWDFDGTLFDTYPVMASVFHEMLKEQGFRESPDEILSYMKISMTYAFQQYEKKYKLSNTFLEQYVKRRRKMELNQCKPYDGVNDICKKLQAEGKKNYLYTHRGASAIKLMKDYDLEKYFEDFVTSQNDFERKPSPEAINYLVDKHKMNKEEAIMIGDREVDILAGKNAGIHACFFAEGNEKSNIADYTIHNLQELYTVL